MNKFRLVFLTLIVVSAHPVLNAQTASADELLRLAEQIIFPSIYRVEMTITTVKPGQPESRISMEIFYKEGAGSFIEMTAPARSRGIRFLEKEASLSLYNPKSNSRRPLRLSPEQSFQGTVFSNNDVSNPQYTDDYEARMENSETIEHPDPGTVDCLVILAEAKRKEAPYGRIKIWIDKKELRPLRFDYYAKSGLLFKSMILSGYRQMAGKMRPSRMHMDSFEIDGAWSEVSIDSLEALDDIPDSRFSPAALTR